MGRSKPRTNKRPPPKPQRQPTAPPPPPASSAPPIQPTSLPYLHPTQPLDLAALMPPSARYNVDDPNLPAAWQQWATQALGKLDSLPKLTQSQISAWAGAAAGAGIGADGAFLGPGTLPTGPNGQPIAGANSNLGIDLPASLAALFEAKLTLDREKAKLMRMQRELKGYREGVAAVNGGKPANGNGKGKEVVVEEECTCGRHGHTHDYPTSAHSGDPSEEYQYYETDDECYDCDCSCHSYVECDHPEGCECEHELEDEVDGEQGDEHDHQHHHHHHHHHHNHHHHAHNHDDDHTYEHDHDHDLHDHGQAHPHGHQTGSPDNGMLQNPIPLDTQAFRAAATLAQQHGNANILHDFLKATAQKAAALKAPPASVVQPGAIPVQAPVQSRSSKRLIDDPIKLDDTVRELFNWIKAVVWTIDQAAHVAGGRPLQAQAAI